MRNAAHQQTVHADTDQERLLMGAPTPGDTALDLPSPGGLQGADDNFGLIVEILDKIWPKAFIQTPETLINNSKTKLVRKPKYKTQKYSNKKAYANRRHHQVRKNRRNR